MLRYDYHLIKKIREESGMYQRDVAVRAGVRTEMMVKWEQGKSIPNANHLAALSTIFDVPITSFFRHTL